MTSPTVLCLSVQLRPNQQTTKQPNQKPNNQNPNKVPGSQQEPNNNPNLNPNPNPNGIIFLRGVRSDNGRIILTRDDTIRLQDSIVALQGSSKEILTLPIGNDKQGNQSVTSIVNNKKDILVNSDINKRGGQFLLWGNNSGAHPSDSKSARAVFLAENLEEENDIINKTEKDEKMCVPVGSDGEPIKLPENLESLPRADHFPTQRHRWNTNEEIAAILISFDRHSEWQSKEVKIRPKSGSMLLYSRKKVRYRRDGYCWKKRKDGKTTREDHMKLKVQGTECIYGCYVHSAILPTFHRRCYWLLQNPDIVLVHYLNVPYPDDNKLAVITPGLQLWQDKKEWTKDELVSQLKPMLSVSVFSEDEPDLNNELEISTAETVETIVSQLMEKQRIARQAALVKQLECGCPDSTCADGKQCSHPIRRISAAKGNSVQNHPQNQPAEEGRRITGSDQVSSTTGTGCLPQNLYTREHPRTQNSQNASQSQTNNNPPLVLSLSQIQGGGGLLILNSPSSVSNNTSMSSASLMTSQSVNVTSFVCNTSSKGAGNLNSNNLRKINKNQIILKQEQMDTSCQINDSQNVKIDIHNGNSNMPDIGTYELSYCREKTVSKKMETEISQKSVQNFTENVTTASNFFNETLDLSHEDIQRTLSANMPSSGSQSETICSNKVETQDPGIGAEINHMDFMEGTDIVVSPTHVVDDDVFVNLDAFDMLGEFPELEVLDGSSTTGLLDVGSNPDCGNNSEKTSEQQSPPMDYREGTANITDYSPEWAYPEGGVKVLVTGPWYSTTSPYTVLFDTFPVPTTLVQSGVLRCYCPAHEAGLVSLQVACEGFVISNSVMFEYKLPPHDDVTTNVTTESKTEKNENFLKFTLLQKLENMDSKLQIKQEIPDQGNEGGVEDTVLFMNPNFEDRLVTYVKNLTGRNWKNEVHLLTLNNFGVKGMTLLHLAANLGYPRLVQALLTWRSENTSLLLETEIDALSQDDLGYTPLMWACAKGHVQTALLLYRWNHTALNIKNLISQTPIEVARGANQITLVQELEKLEKSRNFTHKVTYKSRGKDDNLLIQMKKSDKQLRRAKTDDLFFNLKSHSQNPDKSQNFYEYSNDLILSLSNNELGLMLNNPENPILNSTSPIFSPNNPNLSPASSLASVASTSRSHDGVFLRPGAVTRSESQKYKTLSLDLQIDSLNSKHFSSSPGNNYREKINIKKSSIDSGINMSAGHSSDSLPSLRYRSKPANNREKISRFDRSMSLPLNSPLGQNDNNFETEIIRNSPTRKMEYALWEQDVRVLTLAEQIIAAMPDRIKNESEDMQCDNSPRNLLESVTNDISDVFMEPLLEQSSNFDNPEFNFEFSDHNYRYYDVSTPCSSLSPASSSCLQSPCSFTLDSPSPPPTTADFCEFFQASGSAFENDFSNLTLSDKEQRELYEAAKIIQKAYRSYKGRIQQEQDKERAAAVLIQNYYRRYKQYAYFKQMTKAAMVIQSGYRSYCEHKRFKKSQEAAVCIQNYYRNYREGQGTSTGRNSREGTPATSSSGLKRTYSQRRQHQAARKIQQFMRQSKNNFWDDNLSIPTPERASRKREALMPVIGCPPKVSVSRGQFGHHRSK